MQNFQNLQMFSYYIDLPICKEFRVHCDAKKLLLFFICFSLTYSPHVSSCSDSNFFFEAGNNKTLKKTSLLSHQNTTENRKSAEGRKTKRTRQVSSMIHSASPQSRPAVIVA